MQVMQTRNQGKALTMGATRGMVGHLKAKETGKMTSSMAILGTRMTFIAFTRASIRREAPKMGKTTTESEISGVRVTFLGLEDPVKVEKSAGLRLHRVKREEEPTVSSLMMIRLAGLRLEAKTTHEATKSQNNTQSGALIQQKTG